MIDNNLIREVVRETIEKVLLEYHHSNDDGDLQQMCINTAKYLVNNCDEVISKGWCEGVDGEMIGVSIISNIRKTIPYAAYDPSTGVIQVGDGTIIKCAENNDVRRLASLIYHEAGHKTNHEKSDSAREVFKDVQVPMFVKFDQDVYEAYSKVLYRFNTREMKARCFEATMFLRQSDTLPSLDEYYGDRCTDLTMMKQFIEMLTNMARSENPTSEDKYVVNELYKNIFNKFFKDGNVPHEIKGDKLVNYFTKKYKWFKTRIDKIYYDFKEKIGNNTEETQPTTI